MATSLFKMPFDPERLKVQRIYQSPELSHCQVETMTCPKIQERAHRFYRRPPGAPHCQEEQV